MFASRISVFLVAACNILNQGPALAAGQPLRSIYTSLQRCKPVERLELPERTLEQAKGFGISRCPGVNGYSLYVIDDDPRSWVVLERSKRLMPLERQMVTEFTLGNFPNVASSRNAEWRVDRRGKAIGLIVRIAYQHHDVSANSPASQASALFTFDVTGPEPVLLGIAQNNAEARQLVDNAMR